MTSISVTTANICGNPARSQAAVIKRIRDAMDNGDAIFGQEIILARYKKAWTDETARAKKRVYGIGGEVPISVGPNLHATAAYTRTVHGGKAKVSPTRLYTVVKAVTPDGLGVALVNLHPVSKGYDGAKHRASAWSWRHARLLDYWDAVEDECYALRKAGYTVVVGGDCNWPDPPRPHPGAAHIASSGLDHLWVIAGPNHRVTVGKSSKVDPSKSLGMDHPILTGRFELTAAGAHAAPKPPVVTTPTKPPAPKPTPPKEPTVAAPAPPYVGPPKFHGSTNNKPIHRYVIHATVGQEPGVKGAARNTVAMTKRTSRPSSYHYISDASETLQLTYDSVVAYHAPPNSNSLGHELCCSLSHEGKGHWADAEHQKMLNLAAQNCAQACAAYDIPVVKLSVADLKAGKRGICGHIDVSNAWHQTSHWDPGPYFPWDQFIALVKHYTANPATDPEEMTVAQFDELKKMIEDVADDVKAIKASQGRNESNYKRLNIVMGDVSELAAAMADGALAAKQVGK